MDTGEIFLETDDLRFKVESEKQIIYDSETDEDICMYFDDKVKNRLLNLLNFGRYIEKL